MRKRWKKNERNYKKSKILNTPSWLMSFICFKSFKSRIMKGNKELREEARKLFDEGCNANEIESQLEGRVSKATIYRWLNQFSSVDEIEPRESQSEPVRVENEPNKVHNELQEDQNELITIEASSASNNSQNSATIELRKKKRVALKGFKKVLRRLIELPPEYSHKLEETDHYINSLEDIQDAVEDIYDYDANQYTENLIWNQATKFIERFENMKIKRLETNLHSDVITISDQFQIEVVLEKEDFDEKDNSDLQFIGDFKSLIVEILSLQDQKLTVETCDYLLDKIKAVSAELGEFNELDDDIPEENEVLERLRLTVESLQEHIKDDWWSDYKRLSLDQELKDSFENSLGKSILSSRMLPSEID